MSGKTLRDILTNPPTRNTVSQVTRLCMGGEPIRWQDIRLAFKNHSIPVVNTLLMNVNFINFIDDDHHLHIILDLLRQKLLQNYTRVSSDTPVPYRTDVRDIFHRLSDNDPESLAILFRAVAMPINNVDFREELYNCILEDDKKTIDDILRNWLADERHVPPDLKQRIQRYRFGDTRNLTPDDFRKILFLYHDPVPLSIEWAEYIDDFPTLRKDCVRYLVSLGFTRAQTSRSTQRQRQTPSQQRRQQVQKQG